MDEKDFDILETQAWANRHETLCKYGAFGVDWVAKNIGWGRLELIFDEQGKAHIYAEHMGKDFAKAVLMKLLDEAVVEE